MLRIASTVCPVEPWISLICALISSVAFAVWLASDLTSLATTANPLPASPARAASIVALSASRLVWPAIVADALRRLREPLDGRVGLVRLDHGLAGNLRGVLHLLADLAHRSRQLLSG
jgi:hypothetical protein